MITLYSYIAEILECGDIATRKSDWSVTSMIRKIGVKPEFSLTCCMLHQTLVSLAKRIITLHLGNDD